MARVPTPEEQERIRTGPRYGGIGDKQVTSGGRRRAVPIIKEAPLTTPKPAPVTTLEPVIPQPYVPPKDATVVEKDHWGKPTVLETPDGEKHYTPHYRTMWGELGFKTESEYKAAQRTGEKSQYVGFTLEGGKGLRVPKQLLSEGRIFELKGEEQFKALKRLGAIPAGSKFFPGQEGWKGDGWTYALPAEIKRRKTRFIARMAASIIEPGIDWKLVTITRPKGVVEKGISAVSLFVSKGGTFLNVTEAVRAGHTSVHDYGNWNVTQEQLNKIATDIRKRDNALAVLAEAGYKSYGDSYRVVDALVSDDPKTRSALEVVFSPQDLKAAERWIDRHWGAHGRYTPWGKGEQIPLTKEIQQSLRKVTPWAEEKGGTLLNYLQRIREKLPVPPSPLLAVAPIVATTPMPWDDMLFYSILAGGVAIGLWKLDKATQQATTQFKSTFERSATPEDLVLVSSEGMAMGVADIDPQKRRIPGVSIVPIDPKIPALFPRNIRKELPGISIVKINPKLPPITTRAVEPALYLPTPMISREDLTGVQAGLLKAVAEVAVAKEGLKKSFPSTTTIPINWDQILDEADKAKTIKDIEKAMVAVTDAKKAYPTLLPAEKAKWQAQVAPALRASTPFDLLPSQYAQYVTKHFTSAYQAYLRKRTILAAARQSYVASLNPTPIKGEKSQEAIGIAATYMISQELGLASPVAGEQLDAYLARVLGSQLGSLAATATKTATLTLAKALAQGKTATQAATQAMTATQAAIHPAVRTMTKTAALTQTQTRAITRTMAQTATVAALKTAARTGAIPRPAVATALGILTVTDIPPPPITGGIPLPPGKPKTDKEKRKKIRAAKGAIAWRHGELHGKDVFHVGIYPYTSKEHFFTVVGKKPQNATIVKGPGSAYQTIKLLYGKAPSKKLMIDVGFFDASIKPVGERTVGIGFTPDPKLQTKGDFTTSRRPPPITERRGSLGRGRQYRITPKMPRLRR